MESSLEVAATVTDTNENDKNQPAPLSDFVVYEYGHKQATPGGKTWFTRNYFLQENDSFEFRKFYENSGIYRSAFAYQRQVTDNETVYESQVMGNFYMDFDNEENIELARKDALQAIYLMSQNYRYNLPIEAFRIYFSGKKGFHVIIPWQYFGFKPDYNLDEVFRMMAKDLREFCAYGSLDMSVYERRRVLRMENSIHEGTGLHKIPLTYEQLRDFTEEEIREQATNNFKFKYPKPYLVKQAEKIYLEKFKEVVAAKSIVYSGVRKPLDYTPSHIQELLDLGPVSGYRNNSMAVLASFFNNQGYSVDQIIEEITKWAAPALSGPDPIRKSEIKATVNSIVRRGWNYGVQKIKELIPTLSDNYEPEK